MLQGAALRHLGLRARTLAVVSQVAIAPAPLPRSATRRLRMRIDTFVHTSAPASPSAVARSGTVECDPLVRVVDGEGRARRLGGVARHAGHGL